jgi:hypothetical protein
VTVRHPAPSSRELRRQSLPRRALNRQESALYCGIGEKLFSRLVRMGRAPQPKLISTGQSTLERWTIDQLDEFLDRLPSGDGPATQPPRLLSF